MDLQRKQRKLQVDAAATVQSPADGETKNSAAGDAAAASAAEMKKRRSEMDTETNCRREASSSGLKRKVPHGNRPDPGKRLRKYPTLLNTQVKRLKRKPSIMDQEAERPLASHRSVSEHPSLRKNETVVMAEEDNQQNQDLEMRSVNSARADTLMSLGNETSVMETDSQAVCANTEMGSLRRETFNNDVEMYIKKEPSDVDSDVVFLKQTTAALGTDVSIKSEPSFFGMAVDSDDESPPLVLQEITSEDRMSQSCLSPQDIKIEPGMSIVEDYPDCIDMPVPLLHARYTVSSGAPPPYTCTTSSYKQKLAIKLRQRIAARYGPYPVRGELQNTTDATDAELLPTGSADEVDMVIKCEPVSDHDVKLDQVTGEESFIRKIPRKRGRKKKSPPICAICQHLFCSYSSLKRHYQRKHCVEKLTLSCSLCDAKFARVVQLRTHERVHRGQKTFPCQECDVVFTRACHLKVHMRKHTGERPYTCSVTECNATFSSTSNMNRHMKKHNGQRPYICTVCDANFYQSSHLVSHVRKHTGERPFKCTQCEATFTQPTHLHRHRIRHSGNKPHKCSVCGKGFVENFALQKHARVHSKHLQANRLLKVKINCKSGIKKRSVPKDAGV